jgi:hypothetical protein
MKYDLKNEKDQKLNFFKIHYQIIFKSETLKIRKTKITDRGVYKCLASNLIGYGTEWTIKLSINCKERYFLQDFSQIIRFLLFFILKKVPPKVECQQSIGQAPNFEVDAYMECYVYGFPPPRLT